MSAPMEGLVAIVTGGASGLGAAIARRLREDGARVAIFDVNPDAATDVDLAVAVDVTDDASVDRRRRAGRRRSSAASTSS